MDEKPLVSVLMTVYNREKFIKEAIESVINATYKNIELIVVDDQSSDNSMKIAEEFKESDTRIKTYYNPKNLGDYPNRNKAASYAKGKYIKYVDSDDYIFPNWFDVMVGGMEKFPEAGLGLNRFVRNSVNPGPFFYNSEDAWKLHFFKKHIFGASPLSAIMRSDTFKKVDGFSELRYSGDLDMWLKTTSVSGLMIAEHPLAEWRSHGDQEKEKGVNHYLFTGRQIERQHLVGISCPLNEEDKGAALKFIDLAHCLKIIEVLKSLRNPKLAWQLVRAYKLKPTHFLSTLFYRMRFGKGFYTKLQSRQLM